MKKLSIITINRNNAEGVDFEYIIIDGASTDSSVEVIKEYGDRISYWISEPDSGIYNAMNKGIRKAKGEYCQFLNSGDWLISPDVTERMLIQLTECSILYGNMVKKMPGGKLLINKQIDVNSLLTFYTGALNHSSSYIKRTLFDKYGLYDENLKIVSDWKFFLVAIIMNKEPVVYHNIDVTGFDMNGISNTNPVLVKTERRKVLEEVLPANILADYDNYAVNILQMKRINRYKISRNFVWFLERTLFKVEKFETS
jgi:glycosyltransferase involved in cell wall biosynthesis